jgi:hypothetical protein
MKGHKVYDKRKVTYVLTPRVKRALQLVIVLLSLLLIATAFSSEAQAKSTSSKQLKDGKVYIETQGTTKTCTYKDKYHKKIVKVVVVNRFKSC